MPDKRVPLVAHPEGLTKPVRPELRPLLGRTITVPVDVGDLHLVVFVSANAFETKSIRVQDAAVKLVARRVVEALEGRS